MKRGDIVEISPWRKIPSLKLNEDSVINRFEDKKWHLQTMRTKILKTSQ